LKDYGYEPRIADFGLSIREGESVSGIVGSVSWMAPEILQGNKPTYASDVYAFGIILWEIVTSKSKNKAECIPWGTSDHTEIAKRGNSFAVVFYSLTASSMCWRETGASDKRSPKFESNYRIML
jgi:serine/threonine protein kinase